MKYCTYCGKELFDEAVICPGCGCKAEYNQPVVKNVEAPKKTKTTFKMSKTLKLWIFFGAVAVIIGAVAAVLFMPRNIKMDDFKRTDLVSAIVQYGIPESIGTDDEGCMYLRYGDKHDFYGITPYAFTVYLDKHEVYFYFDSDHGNDVYKKINRYCEFKRNLSDMYHEFSYGDLEITTNDYDGSYVHIKID